VRNLPELDIHEYFTDVLNFKDDH